MKTKTAALPSLVLASASPRRAALLEEAGIAFQRVESGISDDEEERLAASWRALGLAPGEVARRLAVAKALAAERRSPVGARAILGADTVVVLEGRSLGKPRDRAHARSMILELAGRKHEVLTGFALLDRRTGALETGVESSSVELRKVDEPALERFLASGAWSGKAGAYGLQDDEARPLIAGVTGSRSNVVGLPVERVRALRGLRELLAPLAALLLLLFLTGCYEPDEKKNVPEKNAAPPPASTNERKDGETTAPETSTTKTAPDPFVPGTEDGVPQKDLPERKLQAGKTTIQVELATTKEMREVGLMHRDSMQDDHGMLFVYPAEDTGFHRFWMHNTKIALTVAFLKDDGTIVNLEDMEPMTEQPHPSHAKVRLALEMNKGWFELHGLKAGDKVTGLGDVLTLGR